MNNDTNKHVQTDLFKCKMSKYEHKDGDIVWTTNFLLF